MGYPQQLTQQQRSMISSGSDADARTALANAEETPQTSTQLQPIVEAEAGLLDVGNSITAVPVVPAEVETPIVNDDEGRLDDGASRTIIPSDPEESAQVPLR